MKNVRRLVRGAAISIAIAVPAVLGAAPASAVPPRPHPPVYYPVTPPCLPNTPPPVGSSVHPCTPYWLMSILDAMSMGSTEGPGSSVGSSTGS